MILHSSLGKCIYFEGKPIRRVSRTSGQRPGFFFLSWMKQICGEPCTHCIFCLNYLLSLLSKVVITKSSSLSIFPSMHPIYHILQTSSYSEVFQTGCSNSQSGLSLIWCDAGCIGWCHTLLFIQVTKRPKIILSFFCSSVCNSPIFIEVQH